MPYQFERGRIYRMPTHFGPAPGPRQIPAEAKVDSTRSPRKTLVSASFLTEASALERYIPDRFSLVARPGRHRRIPLYDRHRLACRPWLYDDSCLVAGNVQGCARSSSGALLGGNVGKSGRPDYYRPWRNRAAQTLR